MSIEFILGRSGSGKTSLCIDSIVNDLLDKNSNTNLLLLVPEQATYQAEKAVLAQSGIAGFSRLKVLSFNRLEFMLSGVQSAGKDISRIGREMVVFRILRKCRENLKVFKNSALTEGLADELTSTIIELHECDKSPADIEDLIGQLEKNNSDPLLAMKLRDISMVFHEYLHFLEDGFVNPDIALTHARQKVADAEFLQGARLWVDGFASFTIQQQFLLAEMMQTANDSHIALCLDPNLIDFENPDPDKLDPSSIFNLTERTYASLAEMIRAFKLPLARPVLLDQVYRFKKAPALGHIERNIFNPNPEPCINADDSISIACTSNRRGEVDHIARQIITLVRGNGYRFRDIAVIASDVSAYQHYIEAAFRDFGIEYFLDLPKPMAQHPVVELIQAALSAVCDGFSTSDVFAYLKTGLAGIDQTRVDILENYCLAYGIDRHLWTAAKPWSFAGSGSYYDEKFINDLRGKVVRPLEKLKDTLKPDQKITSKAFTAAIYDLLDRLDVFKTISKWTESADESVRLEHSQFFDKLASTFDELIDIFGDEPMHVEDITAVMTNAFSKLSLKLIPQKLDQVLVGSIDRSRHPELKAVFLVGATQKQFPSQVSFDTILNDKDRQVAGENEFYLSDGISDQLTARQYLAYIAFTRPSERLYISYPMSDDEGRQIIPSMFVSALTGLFEDIQIKRISASHLSIENAVSENDLADILCERLGASSTEKDSALAALVSKLYEDGRLSEIAKRVTASLGYTNVGDVNPAEWAQIRKSLIGDELRCSTSRLRTYASCPYQHFAKYILRLEERKLMGFEPMDLGTFYHAVLEGVFVQLKENGKDFAAADDNELKEIAGQVIEKVLEEDTTISIFVKQGMHNKYLIDSACDVLLDCVCDFGTLSRAGTFRQKACEVSFGLDDSLDRFAIETPSGKQVLLRGVIDRVDIAEVDGQKAAVVYDYKRRETSVSWQKMYHGLDTQLGVYMLAVEQIEIDGEKPDFAAGAFYLPVESPSNANPERFARKARGVANGDFYEHLDNNADPGCWNEYYNFYIGKKSPYSNYANSALLRPKEFQALLQFVKQRIGELADGILDGNTNISPYRLAGQVPCDFCDYPSFCRFDVNLNHFNDLKSIRKKALIEEIGDADEY